MNTFNVLGKSILTYPGYDGSAIPSGADWSQIRPAHPRFWRTSYKMTRYRIGYTAGRVPGSERADLIGFAYFLTEEATEQIVDLRMFAYRWQARDFAWWVYCSMTGRKWQSLRRTAGTRTRAAGGWACPECSQRFESYANMLSHRQHEHGPHGSPPPSSPTEESAIAADEIARAFESGLKG